jgi:hypothetical protein
VAGARTKRTEAIGCGGVKRGFVTVIVKRKRVKKLGYCKGI